jgi:hypothetical protein
VAFYYIHKFVRQNYLGSDSVYVVASNLIYTYDEDARIYVTDGVVQSINSGALPEIANLDALLAGRLLSPEDNTPNIIKLDDSIHSGNLLSLLGEYNGDPYLDISQNELPEFVGWSTSDSYALSPASSSEDLTSAVLATLSFSDLSSSSATSFYPIFQYAVDSDQTYDTSTPTQAELDSLEENREFYDSVDPTTNQELENKLVRKALTRYPEPFLSGLKLAGDIEINGLTLNRIDGNDVIWVVTDIDGWWTLPDSEIPDLPRGWGDGSYDAIGRYANRVITLNGSFLPQDPEDAPAARNALLNALSPLVKTEGAGYLIVTDFGQPIQIYNAEEQANPRTVVFTTPDVTGIAVGDYVNVSGILYGTSPQPDAANNFNSTTSGFVVTAVEPGGTNIAPSITIDRGEELGDYVGGTFPGGGTIRKVLIRTAAKVRLSGAPQISSVNARGRHDFSVGLRAVDPIKYEFADGDPDGYRVATITSGTSWETTINNTGNVAVPVIIEIEGVSSVSDLDLPPTITNEDSDQALELVGGVATGHKLEIDTYNREVLDVTYSAGLVTNVENGRSKLAILAEWIYLEPGSNRLYVTNPVTGSVWKVYYRSGWIG